MKISWCILAATILGVAAAYAMIPKIDTNEESQNTLEMFSNQHEFSIKSDQVKDNQFLNSLIKDGYAITLMEPTEDGQDVKVRCYKRKWKC